MVFAWRNLYVTPRYQFAETFQVVCGRLWLIEWRLLENIFESTFDAMKEFSRH